MVLRVGHPEAAVIQLLAVVGQAPTVGSMIGLPEGIRLGKDEGTFDGALVGIELGKLLGRPDGAWVVGRADGVLVGASVLHAG